MKKPERIEINNLLHVRGTDGKILPRAFNFQVYEESVDEEIANLEVMLTTAEPDEQQLIRNSIQRIKSAIADAPTYEGYFRPLLIGEWSEYILKKTSLKEIVKIHLVDEYGTRIFDDEKDLQDLKDAGFIRSCYNAIIKHSGISLSDAAKESIRAKTRLEELKKRKR